MVARLVSFEASLILRGWATSGASGESNYEDDDSKYDPSLPGITLSASDKTGQHESTIPVLGQQFFTGRILPSAVADIRCPELGVQGVLEKLNILDCTPGSPRYKAWEYFVANNSDLGAAYAHLRYQPHDIDIGKHVTEVRKYDDMMRRDLLEMREIGKYAPPRRVWDLRANRVVPWWAASKRVWAISHAWVADDDLKYEMTPINGYEWPVPMPKDADLDLIRIEMLNFGAEYVWLDVLCLRQADRGDPLVNTQKVWYWSWCCFRFKVPIRNGDNREIRRKEEWKVDLPMIGWVYHNAHRVACYLSGLGLPLSFKTDGDFENERCRFNRAWTLQETPHSVVIAGKTCGNGKIDERFMTEKTQERLKNQLVDFEHIQQWTQRGERIFHFLWEMQKRESSKPVDKVAGLVYLLQLKHIPLYDADQHEEDAWTELMNVADGQLRATFLFLYPKPNGNNLSWRPSWEQVMRETFPDLAHISRSLAGVPNVHWTEEDGDSYDGPRMDACHVRGLAGESMDSRYGQLSVKNSSGAEYTFEIFADHACIIPDGLYTLLGVIGDSLQVEGSFWVVGRVEEPKRNFSKVSVVRMAENRKAESFENLDVYRYTKTFLL